MRCMVSKSGRANTIIIVVVLVLLLAIKNNTRTYRYALPCTRVLEYLLLDLKYYNLPRPFRTVLS